MEEILHSASLDELWQLAEAARYADRLDEAYRALGAVQRRFPSSSRGKMATFLLGRLEPT